MIIETARNMLKNVLEQLKKDFPGACYVLENENYIEETGIDHGFLNSSKYREMCTKIHEVLGLFKMTEYRKLCENATGVLCADRILIPSILGYIEYLSTVMKGLVDTVEEEIDEEIFLGKISELDFEIYQAYHRDDSMMLNDDSRFDYITESEKYLGDIRSIKESYDKLVKYKKKLDSDIHSFGMTNWVCLSDRFADTLQKIKKMLDQDIGGAMLKAQSMEELRRDMVSVANIINGYMQAIEVDEYGKGIK